MRPFACLSVAVTLALAASPALALDLNSFRAQHKLPRLKHSAQLTGAAFEHAHDLARRKTLDHDGFYERMGMFSSMAAENVLYGCRDKACAYRVWAKSPGHRRNMLMKGVTRYGLASAKADNGQVYWVLELGN